jgi:hypothetical protein
MRFQCSRAEEVGQLFDGRDIWTDKASQQDPHSWELCPAKLCSWVCINLLMTCRGICCNAAQMYASLLPLSHAQVWLASERPGIAGVVLHSPMLSGVRVFNPNLRWWPAWADIFPNHLLVKKIDVPLLVMHGTADEVRRRV